MNFGFDDDQKRLGETVGRVLADFPALTAPDLGPPPHDAIWRAIAELGLFALMVPDRFGGVGLTLVDLALAVEALGAGLAPPGIATTLAATDVIVRHGSEAQQRALLPSIAAGEMRIAVALLEADQGYDPRDIRTSIAGDRLNGSKILVGDAAAATLIFVVARAGGTRVSAIVEPGAPGVSIRAHDDLDPTSGLCAVTFDSVPVAPDAILPEAATDRLLDAAATISAGLLMGGAACMLDKAVDYARVRVQFGQPIGAFQAIKHRCADMAMLVEAGRSAAYYAFWAVAEDAPDRARAASMAKAYCGDVSRHVCNEAIQIHGGMGFTWDLGLHRFLRRAKVMELSYGDAAWHNERLLRETLADLARDTDHQRDAA